MLLGADVRVETDSQDTPLHCASMEGNLDVVKFLVGLGLDCNYNNSKGRSSVDLALLFEQYDVVQYYGELGADLSSLDLRTAIRSGNVKLVKLASRSDWDTIVYKDLLIEMCSSEEMVDVLLEGHNGDFFVGQGPYLVQCKQYWKKIWTILSKNTTFLDEVAKYPSIITNAWKHNPDAAFDILPYSVRGSENAYHFIKDIDVAKKYMQLCPEDSVNQLGHSTPLHSATKNRDLKHMKYLLEFGADITLKSLHDKNPVEQAVYDGFLEGVMLFFSFFGKEKILEVQKDSSIFVSYFDGLENNSIEMFDFLIQELIVTNENPFQNWKSLKNSRFCTNNAEFNIIRQIHEKYSTVHWFTGFFSKKFLRQMIKTPRLANSVIFFLRLKVFDVNDIVDGDQHTLVHTLLASKQNDAIEWIVSNTKACGM
jgi:ankyrin repeat protein